MSDRELHDVLPSEVGKVIVDICMTTADELREEGFKMGFVKGQRAALLQLLRKRFGRALPEVIVAKIEAGTRGDFEVWFDRLLTESNVSRLLNG